MRDFERAHGVGTEMFEQSFGLFGYFFVDAKIIMVQKASIATKNESYHQVIIKKNTHITLGPLVSHMWGYYFAMLQ